jgi:hypothetical protein
VRSLFRFAQHVCKDSVKKSERVQCQPASGAPCPILSSFFERVGNHEPKPASVEFVFLIVSKHVCYPSLSSLSVILDEFSRFDPLRAPNRTIPCRSPIP